MSYTIDILGNSEPLWALTRSFSLCDAVRVSVYAGAHIGRVRVPAAGRIQSGAGIGAHRAFARDDTDAAGAVEGARRRRSDHRPESWRGLPAKPHWVSRSASRLAIVFEVFQMAAQAVSLQAGLGYASTIDPTSGADSTVLLDYRATHRRAVVLRVRRGPASGQSVGREPAARATGVVHGEQDLGGGADPVRSVRSSAPGCASPRR